MAIPTMPTPTQITSGLDASSPAVTALANGTYVVVYRQLAADGLQHDIKAQIIGSTGTPVGSAFTINTTTAGEQGLPGVAALSGGGFVVTWSSDGQDGSESGVYAQRFDASGTAVGSETLVNTTTSGIQSQPQVTGLSNGNYVITWSSDQGTSNADIYQRIFDSSGAPLTSEVRVNTSLSYDQLVPGIAALDGGGYVITWQTSVADVSGPKGRTLSQLYDASGNAVGGEVSVSDRYNPGVQYYPTVGGLADGSYVVALAEGSTLSLKRYDATGTLLNVSAVGTVAVGAQPQIVSFSDNTYIVTWTQNGNTSFYQQFHASGATIGNTVFMTGLNPVLAGAANDDFIWVASSELSGVDVVRTAVFDVTSINTTTPGNDFLFGTSGDDTIYGGQGNDFVEGRDGQDLIRGEDGNDSLIGGSADDSLRGNAGNDVLWGETGNDELIGGSGEDRLFGQDGNDVVWGEVGNDTISGGDGDDKIYGQDGFDILLGGDGVDTIEGGTSGDAIIGGSGADLLYGGSGPDTFYFQDKSAEADYIFDFNRAEGDKIAFTASAFNAPVNFTLIPGSGFLQGAGVTPVAATATVYFDTTTSALWYDADGTGAESGHVIAFLMNNPTLQASDFVFVA